MKKTLLTTLAVFLALVPAFAGTFSKSYDFKDFCATRLYEDSKAWAQKNGLRLWSS